MPLNGARFDPLARHSGLEALSLVTPDSVDALDNLDQREEERDDNEADDASQADTMCDATLCAANEYVNGNACAACGPGSTNDPGDDASQAATMCDATRHAANEYAHGNPCAPCCECYTHVHRHPATQRRPDEPTPAPQSTG